MGEKNRLDFSEVVTTHGDSIYRLCKAYIGNSDDLDDLYQETLINIWKALPRFRGDSKLSTWIYRVTVNTSISFRRKNIQEESRKVDNWEPELWEEDLSEKNEKITREKQYQKMLECIESLKADQRIIIGLYLENLSYKEIADVVGKSTNYIGVNITRIKERLSKLMVHERIG
ncbi:MAG: RNA polymerase sigma factor [Marinoscillum sp.]